MDHKYYIILRGINGKLYHVEGLDKKMDVWKYVSEHLSLGYQLTTVSRAVMMTATNLFEAREKLGLPHPNLEDIMTKLKMRKEEGVFIINVEEREMIFPTLRDALEYIWYRKFMALVMDEPIVCRNDTLYPVNSLLPPVVEKVAKFYDLGAEII